MEEDREWVTNHFVDENDSSIRIARWFKYTRCGVRLIQFIYSAEIIGKTYSSRIHVVESLWSDMVFVFSKEGRTTVFIFMSPRVNSPSVEIPSDVKVEVEMFTEFEIV